MSCNDCTDACNACQRPRYAPIKQLVQAIPYATRIVATDESGALAAAATADEVIDWKDTGWVVGISGVITRQGGADSMAAAVGDAAFSVRSDGADEKPLVTDGTARSFSSFALFGLDLSRVLPVLIPIRPNDSWLVNFLSRAGTAGQRVQLLFHFVRDKDIKDYLRDCG